MMIKTLKLNESIHKDFFIAMRQLEDSSERKYSANKFLAVLLEDHKFRKETT